MRSLGHEVTRMAVWAANDGNVFNHKQVIAGAVSLRDLPDEGAIFPAVIAKHFVSFQIE